MASIYAYLLEQKKAYAQEKFSTPTGLVWNNKHGRRFIVFWHQYGRCDVMWKHSISLQRAMAGYYEVRQAILLLSEMANLVPRVLSYTRSYGARSRDG